MSASLIELPSRILYDMLYTMDLKTLTDFCKTHPNIRYLCDLVIRDKFTQDFNDELVLSGDSYTTQYRIREIKRDLLAYVTNQFETVFPHINLTNEINAFVNEIMEDFQEYISNDILFFDVFDKNFSPVFSQEWAFDLQVYSIYDNIVDYVQKFSDKQHLFPGFSKEISECPTCGVQCWKPFLNKYGGVCKFCIK